ncbi:MAG: DNA alkylation repair protein [Labilithrix sp.]|nr:DNA alkylation repair protein [Labilithrix sp.]
MNRPVARKGATRAADIPRDVLDALSRGEMQSATLAECLALDQARLLRTAFPGLSRQAYKAAEEACRLGILKRMRHIGALLLDELGTAGIERCAAHASDTVRGWACFMIDARLELGLSARLTAIQPMADDAHFGVREWAWMAARPHLARELDEAVGLLVAWTASPSERERRFSSEVLRPRGVWCAHIALLKEKPETALPILSKLRADRSAYVQDSVANWLNDAAKDNPEWVQDLCRQWQRGEPSAATRRLCHRALRNLR